MGITVSNVPAFRATQATRHNIKSYLLPVGGAVVLGLVGGLVGGPIGLVAGANIGAAAALTGGTPLHRHTHTHTHTQTHALHIHMHKCIVSTTR